jgi:hypothetical protein
MPPGLSPLTLLARSINRILEVDQKWSERWWGISTKSRCCGITHRAAARELPMTLRAHVWQLYCQCPILGAL